MDFVVAINLTFSEQRGVGEDLISISTLDTYLYNIFFLYTEKGWIKAAGGAVCEVAN